MPTFIVGYPRSGTTLAQRLVSEGFGLPTLPETHFFEALSETGSLRTRLKPERVRALFTRLANYLALDSARYADLLASPLVGPRALFMRIVEEQLGSAVVAADLNWVEKTPGHALQIDSIGWMFPRARFIYMLRDPLMAFASRRELTQPGAGWGEAWRPIELMCADWLRHLTAAEAFEAAQPGRLMFVKLEELSSDAPSTLRRIGHFLGHTPVEDVVSLKPERVLREFESWKMNALLPESSAIAARQGKPALDAYDTWRTRTLLAEALARHGYPAAPCAPPELDALHRKLVASIDLLIAGR